MSKTEIITGFILALLLGIAVGIKIMDAVMEDQHGDSGMCADTITEVYSPAAEDQDREVALNRVFESDMECRTK